MGASAVRNEEARIPPPNSATPIIQTAREKKSFTKVKHGFSRAEKYRICIKQFREITAYPPMKKSVMCGI